MKVGRIFRTIESDDSEKASTFYGRYHNTDINLGPEFSRGAHAPISDSYGSCEDLGAWKSLNKDYEHPKNEEEDLERLQKEPMQEEAVKKRKLKL